MLKIVFVAVFLCSLSRAALDCADPFLKPTRDFYVVQDAECENPKQFWIQTNETFVDVPRLEGFCEGDILENDVKNGVIKRDGIFYKKISAYTQTTNDLKTVYDCQGKELFQVKTGETLEFFIKGQSVAKTKKDPLGNRTVLEAKGGQRLAIATKTKVNSAQTCSLASFHVVVSEQLGGLMFSQVASMMLQAIFKEEANQDTCKPKSSWAVVGFFSLLPITLGLLGAFVWVARQLFKAQKALSEEKEAFITYKED